LSFCSFSFGHCVFCSSSIYRFWLPPFGIFKLFLSFCSFSFDHCVVCSSSIYRFWLPSFGIFRLFYLLILYY
jgi:hypothetical protein